MWYTIYMYSVLLICGMLFLEKFTLLSEETITRKEGLKNANQHFSQLSDYTS